MKHRTTTTAGRARRIVAPGCVAAMALAFATALPQAQENPPVPPAVPDNIRVPAGFRAYLVSHAAGTQNYMCLPSGKQVAWTFQTPQATGFDGDGDAEQMLTHFLSPNPLESGTARATWQHSRDTSAVWARRVDGSSDEDFVEPGAIPWLLLEVTGAQDGPTGGARLSATKYIQRVNTSGGSAPEAGCKTSKDLYKTAFVPYSSDYFFFHAAGGGN